MQVYTLEEIYKDEGIAVECLTSAELAAYLEMVRADPPEGFQDYWLSTYEGGLGDRTFMPVAPVCISLWTVNHAQPAFGFCDREWYEENGYLVITFGEIGNEPRELVSEGLESLFNLEVL